MQESFINHLISNYHEYCLDKSINPDTANFLTYLLTYNLIHEDVIRRYVVVHEFQYLIDRRKFKNKTQTVKALAEKYDLHQSTIWSLIK